MRRESRPVLGLLVAIAGVVAVGAWLVAAYSAARVILLVPRGERLRSWFTLGWWQFDKLRALGGPAAEPHLRRYVRGFVTFFAAIILSFVAGALATASAQNGAPADGQAASEPRRITDPRIFAVGVAGAPATLMTSSVLET